MENNYIKSQMYDHIFEIISILFHNMKDDPMNMRMVILPEDSKINEMSFFYLYPFTIAKSDIKDYQTIKKFLPHMRYLIDKNECYLSSKLMKDISNFDDELWLKTYVNMIFNIEIIKRLQYKL